ncbi:acetolactate synthase large subunit [Nioella sp.]|uniref:acetolactate synthase large subunit n=1 Tax=Nioella sp. TaxID=1912091 RepID=UPI003B529F7B
MNGAQSLVKTMLASGVDVCFANPGTSEMHFVAALDSHPDMRCILCLFEGGTSGAADGYFRMSGRVAATMLHLAPGFGNAFSNLHNARKAGSGIVNIMGDHATYHLAYESPLKGDTEGISRAISHWTRSSLSSVDVASDGADAIRAARAMNGRIATMILPADTAWGDGSDPVTAAAPPPLHRPSDAALDAAAAALKTEGAALLLGGQATHGPLLHLGAQIAQAAGCRILTPLHSPRMERGAGTPPVEQLLYPVDANAALLKDVRSLVVCGTHAPVNFFAYPGKPSLPTRADIHIQELADATMDLGYVLNGLADRLGARSEHVAPVDLALPDRPDGPLTPASAGALIARVMPENTIVVNEAVTSGAPIAEATRTARRHDWLITMGGAIGQCLPCATGAAVACPDRKVIALTGDGSAMYTLQSLWTMARERLDVTVIVFANRGYQILRGELAAMGVTQVGRNAQAMFDVDDPLLDWVALAKGHGVEGTRATTVDEMEAALEEAMAANGPRLIEVVI